VELGPQISDVRDGTRVVNIGLPRAGPVVPPLLMDPLVQVVVRITEAVITAAVHRHCGRPTGQLRQSEAVLTVVVWDGRRWGVAEDDPHLDVDMSRPELVISAISWPGALAGQVVDAGEMGREERGEVEVFHRDPQTDRNARLRAGLDDSMFGQ
jgi:hypothetical protein